MKKFCFFSIILSFFLSYLFSSQPAETGLIFGHTHSKRSSPAPGVVPIRKTVLPSGHRFSNGLNNAGGAMIRKTVNPIKEKRNDNSYSNVFQIDGLQQFLHLATREKKPLVIKIVSQQNQQFIEFQELADRLKDSAVFISMDASKNHTTIKLLLLILRSEGADLTDRQIKLPIFLLSNKGFVVLQNGLVNFQSNNLKFLNEGDVDNNELERSILQALGAESGPVIEEISGKKEPEVERDILEKRSKMLKYWKKFKMWIRSKF